MNLLYRRIQRYFWSENTNPTKIFTLLGFVFFLLLFLIYPLIKIYWVPIQFGKDPLALMISLFENPGLIKSFRNTFFVLIGTVFISNLVAIPSAWLVTRTNTPFAKNLKTLLSLPYAIPPFFGAIAWIFLANPSNGVFNQILGENTINIYSIYGLIFIESSFLFTFIFISTCAALEQMDSSLEEAAQISGASPVRLFFAITLPLIRSTLTNSSLLVALASLASFGVPAMIGGPGGFKLLTTEIYQLQKMGTESGLLKSISLSEFLLLITFAVIFITQFFTKNKSFQTVSGKTSRSNLIDLKIHRWTAFSFLVLVVTLVLILPMGSLFVSALSKQQGTLSFANLSFANFERVLNETEELGRAFKNSMIIATTVALLCTTFSFSLSLFMFYTRKKGLPLLNFLIALPNSVPGTVIAISLIYCFSRDFYGLNFSIYNTLTIFILAFSIKYLNQAFKPIFDQLFRIHSSLIESAETSGAPLFETFIKIWIPLIRPALLASLFFVFIPSFSELTISILLTGPGMETIGTMIYQLQEYSDNYGGGSAVLACLIFLFIMINNFLLKKYSKGKYGL